MIKKEEILVSNIPAMIWGDSSPHVYIYVHGKMGSKEEAESFAEIVNAKGFQTLSFDLPEHGERTGEDYPNNIWNGIHDLKLVADYAKSNWKELNLYAVSIGAFYSLMAYQDLKLNNCMFVSPILDMEKLIRNMMGWANVSEEQLQKEGSIETSFGETLDWDYYTFVKENPITKWEAKAHILYGMKDNLTDFDTVMAFTKKFDCDLHTYTHMEHHLHTKEDLEILANWQGKNI